MFVLTVIILFLTVRLVFRRRNVVEKELVSPLEMLNNEYQRVSDVTSIVQEFRLVRHDKTVDTKISFQKDKEKVDPDINPLPITGGSDECKYCLIFKDLSSIVCPNCGRPLNLSTRNQAE